MTPAPNLTETDAVLSDCGQYRYSLLRKWRAGDLICTFVMLNPSTADARADDPTIRRCMNFARREGCDGLRVLNLFALRATDPRQLRRVADPIGPRNDETLAAFFAEDDGPLIAAWGAHGQLYGRSLQVRRMTDRPFLHLGLTQAGEPMHPLYRPSQAPLERLP